MPGRAQGVGERRDRGRGFRGRADQPQGDPVGAAQAAIVGLSLVGAVLEFWGIVVVAGRVDELRGRRRRLARAAREHYRSNHRRLMRLFWRPPIRFPPWLKPATQTIKVGTVYGGGGVAGGIEVRGRRVGISEERLAALEDEVYALTRRVDRLAGGLPAQIEEGVKDPWRGLVLLFLGIVFLLAASVIGAFNT